MEIRTAIKALEYALEPGDLPIVTWPMRDMYLVELTRQGWHSVTKVTIAKLHGGRLALTVSDFHAKTPDGPGKWEERAVINFEHPYPGPARIGSAVRSLLDVTKRG